MEKVKLQEFMNRNGFTQQKLADAIGVKRAMVAAWNTGRADITRENCGKLLAEGMSLEELFGLEVASKVRAEILSSVEVSEKDSSVLNLIDALEKILMAAKASASKQ